MNGWLRGIVWLACAAIALAAIDRLLPGAVRPTRPSIVVLSLDTLRADHLSAYGYRRHTSPALDAFAREAVRFEQAIAQASGTLPSHLSLLSSLNPPQFQITRPDGRNDDQGRTTLRLPEAVVTLAEVLRDAGYETAAFTDGGSVHPRYGMSQGFDAFRVNATRGLTHTLAELERFAFERAARLAGVDPAERPPVFLFLHTFDVHAPYDAPPPFDRRFSTGTFAELRDALGPGRVLDALAAQPEPSASARSELEALYDNGIAWTDAGVGRLLAQLRANELYEEAIVVVLSDHGEELYDHGGFNHGKLYREHLHVPLLIRLPGARRAGRVVQAPVALVDVAPTLLELAGLPPVDSFAGESLLRWIESGTEPQLPRPIYFETPDRRIGLRGLRAGRWKLIASDTGGTPALYDVEDDPDEQRNLATARPARAAALAAQLTDWVEAMEAEAERAGWLAVHNAEAPDLSDVQRETLRALGYIEETAPARESRPRRLP